LDTEGVGFGGGVNQNGADGDEQNHDDDTEYLEHRSLRRGRAIAGLRRDQAVAPQQAR
jgi:hypothetical protein